MDRQYGDLINYLDEIIVADLSSQHHVDNLSQKAGLSKFHLHRIFAAQTGFEIAEYIQRRKMERALAMLNANTANSVIDIALAVGYESHSAFSRVFKQSYGITPNQVQKGAYYEPLIKYKKKRKQELDVPATSWLYLPELPILGKFCKGFEHASFARIASTTFEHLTELSDCSDYIACEPVGVSMNNPWSQEHREAQFFCGLLSGLEQVDKKQLELFTWPEGHYISTTYTGPYRLMWQFISQLHSRWAEQGKVKLTTRQVIQRYLNHPRETSPEALKTQLYFAVENFETV